MKTIGNAFGVVVLLAAVPAWAQEATKKSTDDVLVEFSGGISPGVLAPTAEMWFYEQSLREYLDPKMAVRKKAEFRAAQRERRLASRRWFGLSNQRPQAFSDPYHGDYSPRWTSNNAAYPFRWSGEGRPWIVLRPGGPGVQALY